MSTTVVGNLTADPELTYTSAGTAKCELTIAQNFGKKDDENKKVIFHSVTLWEQAAENAAESLQKGDRIIGTGRYEQEFWEKDGEKRSKYVLRLFNFGPDLSFATAVVSRNERQG